MKLIKTQKFPPFCCPRCRQTVAEFTYTDGETLSFDEEIGDGRLDAAIMFGACEHCGAKVYGLEVSVIPQMREGFRLVNDWYFQWISQTNYTVPSLSYSPWALFHYEGVSNLFFTGEGTTNMVAFNAPWLDVHWITPWLSDEPFEEAEEMLIEIAPSVLIHEWPMERTAT